MPARSVRTTANATRRSAWNVPAHPNSLALDARRNVLYTTIKCGEHEAKDAQESVARIALDVPIIKAME